MNPWNQRSRFVQPQHGQFGGFPRNVYQNGLCFSNNVQNFNGPSVERMQQQHSMQNQNSMSYRGLRQSQMFHNNQAQSHYGLQDSGMLSNPRMGQQLQWQQNCQISGQFQNMQNSQMQVQNFSQYSGCPRNSSYSGQGQIRPRLSHQGQGGNRFSSGHGNNEMNFRQGSKRSPQNKGHLAKSANTGLNPSLLDLSLSSELKATVDVKQKRHKTSAKSKESARDSATKTNPVHKKHIGSGKSCNAISTKPRLQEDTSDTGAMSSTETTTSKSSEEKISSDNIPVEKTHVLAKTTAKQTSSSHDSSKHKDALKTMAEETLVHKEESQNKDQEEENKIQNKNSNIRPDVDDCCKESENEKTNTSVKDIDEIATVNGKTKPGTESVSNKSAVNISFSEVFHVEVVIDQYVEDTIKDKVEECDKQKVATNETKPDNNKLNDAPNGMMADVSKESSDVVQEQDNEGKGDRPESPLRSDGLRVKDMLEGVASMTLGEKKSEEYNVISSKEEEADDESECQDDKNKKKTGNGTSKLTKDRTGVDKSDGELAAKFKLKPLSVKLYRLDKSDKLIEKDVITAAKGLKKKNTNKSISDMVGSEPMETAESSTNGKEGLSPALYQDFVDDEDDYDDVDDDESDDDVLSTAPAFLKSIDDVNTAFGKPQAESPVKTRLMSGHGGIKDSPSSSMEYHSPLDPQPRKFPGPKSKFTLDNLLAEHVKNIDHKKEMDVIKSELKAGIQEGGFVEIINREEKSAGDLLLQENQQEVLRQFKIEESNICYDRPGVNIFENQQYLCVFDSSLHPVQCGFMLSGKSQLAKHLSTVTPAQYRQLLTTSVISMCFSKLPCQAAVLKWLFFLMSVEENHHICRRCEVLLQEILHKHHTQLKCFPDVYDLLSVLVNYGANLETLVPNEIFPHESIRSKLHHQAEYHKQQVKNEDSTVKGYRKKNLLMILQFMALSMHRKSVTMSADELTLLLVVLCKASLDTVLKHSCGVDAFQTCVVKVIKLYTDSDWEKQRLKVSRLISSLTDHHHNMASVAELLPKIGDRGLYLQRVVGYRMLSWLLKGVESEVDNVQIRDLHEFVGPIKELLINDPYKLASIVTILDVCVGINVSLKSKEREDLKDLIELVNGIRVQDNVSVLDRTRVKDMLVRLTSSWSLDVQTMKGKQTKIFEYAVHDSPVKMKIETVETRQSDNDTASDSQSDDGEMPCKVQKI